MTSTTKLGFVHTVQLPINQ